MKKSEGTHGSLRFHKSHHKAFLRQFAEADRRSFQGLVFRALDRYFGGSFEAAADEWRCINASIDEHTARYVRAKTGGQSVKRTKN